MNMNINIIMPKYYHTARSISAWVWYTVINIVVAVLASPPTITQASVSSRIILKSQNTLNKRAANFSESKEKERK